MFLKDNNTNNTNGYHHQQPPPAPPEMVHNHSNRDRARHGTRRSRVSTSNSRVRVSDAEQPQQPTNRSPCTDYDMAYFHSYAHLGIHQEMIKVLTLPLFCYFLRSDFSQLYIRHAI